MATRRIQAPTPRAALVLVTAVVVGIVLYLGRDALTPFLFGLLLIYVLDPAVRWFHRKGLRRGLAVLVVYVLAFGVVAIALSLLLRPLVSQVASFVGDLPRFNAALDEAGRRLREVYDGLQLPDAIRQSIERAFSDLGQTAGAFDIRAMLPIAGSIAGALGALFGYLIVPVWAFYILKDRDRLLASFERSLPAPWRQDIWAVLQIVERVFGRWLRAQIFLGLVVGGATFVGLIALGVVIDPRFTQFAILLAVVAGLFELLPIIGPILSMIPSLLVALTVSPQAVVAVFLLYLLVQQLENNILVPKIQGDAVDLHPSLVIFSLIVGGSIAGLLGAILALPITAAGKEVYRYLFRRLGDDYDGVEIADEPGPAGLSLAADGSQAATNGLSSGVRGLLHDELETTGGGRTAADADAPAENDTAAQAGTDALAAAAPGRPPARSNA